MEISISQIANDYGIFEAHIEKLISLCAYDVRSRNSMKDIDTVLLRDALEVRQLAYDSQFFWNLYKALANEFESNFKNLDVTSLAFAKDYEICIDFLKELWQNYFFSEIKSIHKNNSDFAVYILKAATRPEESLSMMNFVNQILKGRYSIIENK